MALPLARRAGVVSQTLIPACWRARWPVTRPRGWATTRYCRRRSSTGCACAPLARLSAASDPVRRLRRYRLAEGAIATGW